MVASAGATARASDTAPRTAAWHEERAVARELLGEERHACWGLSAEEERHALTALVSDVDGAFPLFPSVTRYGTRPVGAVIALRPALGRSAEWLERAFECHVARRAAHGATRSEAAGSPLDVPGANVTVRSGGDRFRVEIRGDFETAPQVLAQALAGAERLRDRR